MPRWEPDAPERLERAAVELFLEQGFDATTVPQIAQRAGMTTRTFFRHFADKREVLFLGTEEIPAKVAWLLSSAPPGLELLDLMSWGVETVAREFFEGRHAEVRLRCQIIESDAGLKERELRKQAEMAAAMAQSLIQQGHDPLGAMLASKTAITIFSTAITFWALSDGERTLVDHAQEARRRISELAAGNVLGLSG